AVHGHLPGRLHRGDARLGERPPAPHRGARDMSGFISYAPIFPEILLLVGACALMIADLYVKDEGRGLTLWLSQGLLLACAAVTLLLFSVQWYAGGHPRLMLNGLFVSDLMPSSENSSSVMNSPRSR